MIYEGGTLYANIYEGQIHQYDVLTHRLKVYQVDQNSRVISAMRYSTDDAIYRPAFLIYDLAKEQLVAFSSTENSRNLTFERRVNFSLSKTNILPRDIYSCNFLSHNSSINFVFF